MTTQELLIKIEKKKEEIAKREKNLVKYAADKEFVAICDRFFQNGAKDFTEIRAYNRAHGFMFSPDYYGKRYELEDAKATLVKYEKLLAAAQDKENSLKELPQVLVEFKNNLIASWDAYDEWKKQMIIKERKTLSVPDMRHKWGANYYDFMFKSAEDIHKANVNAAETLILNLVDRTIAITGKITDCKCLTLDRDNNGYAIINGVIIGEKGKVHIDSIGAGGYNIQRYHIRVLVKEMKK